MTVFGHEYSDIYDAIYADKDYVAETDLIDRVFRANHRPVRTVLDLGCGTGRHAIELARRGFEVMGIDLSPDMLALARARVTPDLQERVSFEQADITELELGRRFDAVVCMFAVLGYQIEDAALVATLANVRRHLEPGGVFVFDVWYGPAVRAIGPSRRTKVVERGNERIERRALGTLDAQAPVCSVRYEVTRSRPGQADVTLDETHRMRYFDEPELRARLAAAGLTLVSLADFDDVRRAPSIDSWNVLAVAAG